MKKITCSTKTEENMLAVLKICKSNGFNRTNTDFKSDGVKEKLYIIEKTKDITPLFDILKSQYQIELNAAADPFLIPVERKSFYTKVEEGKKPKGFKSSKTNEQVLKEDAKDDKRVEDLITLYKQNAAAGITASKKQANATDDINKLTERLLGLIKAKIPSSMYYPWLGKLAAVDNNIKKIRDSAYTATAVKQRGTPIEKAVWDYYFK